MIWHPVVDTPCALGESPFWHPQEQRLYWVDIEAHELKRCGAQGQDLQTWRVPSEPGCIAPARNAAGQPSGLVLALRDGFYRAAEWGGPLKLLAPALHDPTRWRFNDGKADPSGRFWASTIYEPRGESLACLYSFESPAQAAGAANALPALQLRAEGATVGNGLAWSPDARTLYWGDTTTHTVRAWDWDAAHNTLQHERVFARWPTKPAGWQAWGSDAAQTRGYQPGYGGRPDGAAVDAEGNYYVAMFEGARVLKLSPAGAVLAEFPVPAACPTMPCFGGPDLRTLYLTTARHQRSAAELQGWPLSGCVFAMRVDVPGLPVNFFIDQ